MTAQTTNQLLTVRPACFGFNPETAESNTFQYNQGKLPPNEIAKRALKEFDVVVETLMACNIDVFVVEDSPHPPKPDSIFPNNWISFHECGTLITYPMMSQIRRTEVREDLLEDLVEHFDIDQVWRLDQETSDRFLEGTGSMVLDRKNKIAYACNSPRTSEALLEAFCKRMNFKPIVFDATDEKGVPVYHTNVIMNVTRDYVIICMEAIADNQQRELIRNTAKETDKIVVEIAHSQVNQFAGNMLQVGHNHERPMLVMSQAARDCLLPEQITVLENESDLIAMAIPTIEKHGGGSIRCMLAEIFTPAR